MIKLLRKRVRDRNENNKQNESKEERISFKVVEINIVDKENNDIIFKYSWGDYKKIKNGKEVMSAVGYNYKDFLNQVLYQYPLYDNKYFEVIEKIKGSEINI